MARKRRHRVSALVVGLLMVVAAAGAAWWWRGTQFHGLPSVQAPIADASIAVAADRIDPANEGRQVLVAGRLRAVTPVRDPELGVRADAVALLRQVEMLQWREKCAGADCGYALEWSPQPIDSSAFKVKGHQNPLRLPFASNRFLTEDVRLGAFRIDAAAAAAGIEPVALAVHAAQLPPNLAATFRERDGMLNAGSDPERAAAGDVRVSYRVVPAGERSLAGIQRGNRIVATPSN